MYNTPISKKNYITNRGCYTGMFIIFIADLSSRWDFGPVWGAQSNTVHQVKAIVGGGKQGATKRYESEHFLHKCIADSLLPTFIYFAYACNTCILYF